MCRSYRFFLLELAITLLWGAALNAAEIRGFVADVRGGERLERVRLRLVPVQIAEPEPGKPAPTYEAITATAGEFALANLPAGEYELTASTVGYRLFKQKFTVTSSQTLELEIALSPEAFTQRETIEVTEHVFEPLETMAPTERTLTHNEVKNLGSVLADDPLRAVQAMPGVSAGDDFESRFAIRGAGFDKVGIYLDGVLLHEPFHSLHSGQATGSITTLNGDMVENLSLMTGGFSARYGDRTAGVVAVTSREGGRLKPAGRIVASASNAGVLAEGPIGGARRGSWMAAFRKSYLDYIIRRTSSDPSIAFGFLDGQGRVVYDLTPKLQASLHVASGDSGLDRTHFLDRIGGFNALIQSDARMTLGILGLRYTAGPRLLLNGRVAALRESYLEWNREHTPLGSGRYREYITGADATVYWREGAALELGGDARRLHDEAVRTQAFGTGRYSEYERYRGQGWLSSAYAQQTWVRNRLRLGAGMRFDRLSPGDCVTPARPSCRAASDARYSPRLSAAVPLPFNQSLRFGWGQYWQFPELRALVGAAGNPGLSPERSTHYLAAWDWQIQERIRASVEVYNREDRNGIWQPLLGPWMLPNGQVIGRNYSTPFTNGLIGYARGIEVMLQRRSANRLTGWVSYAYSRTHARDTLTGLRFPYEWDQPHTFNTYASYRVRPSINLSAKWIMGSGFPVPESLRVVNGQYYLGIERNRVRLDRYQRLDLRVNKTFLTRHRRVTLYGEVINVLNRRNLRFSELNSWNTKSGAAYPHFDRMFPIIPSAGMVLEF